MEVKIQEYETIIGEVREEFTEKYFDTTELLQEIQKSEGEIKGMLTKNDENKKKVQLRQQVLRNSFRIHNQRENINIFQSEREKQRKDCSKYLSQYVKKNTQVIIKLRLKKLIPVLRKNAYLKEKSSFVGRVLTFFLHHLDKKYQLKQVFINKKHEIMNQEHLTFKRNMDLIVKHIVREQNEDLMKHLLNKEDIHIFCETEGKLILGWCQINLGELLFNSQKSLFFKFKNCRKEIFSIKVEKKIQINALSPEIQLLRKVSEKLSRSKKKSKILQQEEKQIGRRSPSPLTKKHYVKSIISNEGKKISVLHEYQMPLIIKRQMKSSLNLEPVFDRLKNISKREIELDENGDTLLVKVSLKEQTEEGSIQFYFDNKKYDLLIKPNNLFKVFSSQESRQTFKNDPQAYKKNAIIQLAPEIFVYPSLNTRINRNQIEQYAVKECLSAYFLKTEFDGLLIEMPWQIKFHVKKVENGHMIYYIIQETQPNKIQIPISMYQKRKNSVCELHYFTCIAKEFNIQLTKQIQIEGKGIYQLDTSSILKQKNKYKIRNLHKNLLFVINDLISESYAMDYILIQILEEIQDKKEAILIIDDLQKNNSTPFRLTLLQRERKVNWDFKL